MRPFEKKIWLSSPTMHGEELQYVREAIESNWVSTLGANINALEEMTAKICGVRHAAALSSGTAALHMCMKLAAEKVSPEGAPGASLQGQKVFCSDMTFSASVDPVLYENGTPVFIDTDENGWNMDPEALERAFQLYPDVRIVVLAHLYGVPARMDEILEICKTHGALIVEDAAEALGASYEGQAAGSFGTCNAMSFNGNKIVTGSSGGMFLTDSPEDAEKVRKWSTQSREPAPWYQHRELGYNYRMSNIVAGIARGNLLHLEEHIAQKKAIYERYREGLKDLPVTMNPLTGSPNYWLSCILIDKEAMCPQVRTDREASYTREPGKSCPTQILETLSSYNAEGRPIWKPMHLQPLYRSHIFVKAGEDGKDVGADIFERGLCLPSDNKMTPDQQDRIIEIIKSCFE